VEATCPILDNNLKRVLKNILDIQLSDNVKARILDNGLNNRYVNNSQRRVRSQVEIYNYLQQKLLKVATPEMQHFIQTETLAEQELTNFENETGSN
ncbi:MAG: hypothetical protein ACXWV5_11835, partial [Flavitalea sp.]